MLYDVIRQMHKMLGQMDQWLEAARSFAEEKSFDSDVFLSFRLAPNQFALVKQVQITCDTAKLVAARLAGREAPKHSDTEESLEALRSRIASVREYLQGFSAADFDGARDRVVTQPRWEGKVMGGHDYFLEHGLPNFFFHLTHVYAILRHNGVALGKRNYLGPLSLR